MFIGHVICSVELLLELAKGKCREEHCDKFYNTVTHAASGCCLIIHTLCENGHSFRWDSSKSFYNQNNQNMYYDNLDFASAVILSGNNFHKMEQFFRFLNTKIISTTSFFAYQRLYICSAIDHFYQAEQVGLSFILKRHKGNYFIGKDTKWT